MSSPMLVETLRSISAVLAALSIQLSLVLLEVLTSSTPSLVKVTNFFSFLPFRLPLPESNNLPAPSF